MKSSTHELELRAEVREFMRRTVDEDMRVRVAREGLEYDAGFQREMGASGLIGLQWPSEFGGRAGSFVDAAILQEEGGRAGAPMIAANTNSFIGNTLIRHGSPSLRAEFIPRLCKGEVVFCLGYSEPDAGSDLASLRTRAVFDGDEVIINGVKQFTSLGSVADYMCCAVRTDPSLERHRGISVVIVPMEAVDVRPIWTLGGFRTNASFLDHVSVPMENVIGDVNGGWSVLGTALTFERSGTIRVGEAKRVLELWEDLLEARSASEHEGALVARHRTLLASVEWLAYRLAWRQDNGEEVAHEAAVVKILTTTALQAIAEDVLRSTSADAQVDFEERGSQLAELDTVARNCVRFSVTGGTNEIQRNIIARRGLGLPKT